MPEVLEGATPGITVEEAIAQCCDLFGFKTTNARFRNSAIRNFNRALGDIWAEHPTLRRFTVHDAPVTLQPDVAVYDVTKDVEEGGFGWERCFEVLDVIFGADRIRPLEKITLENWRFREPNYQSPGVPEGIVIIDSTRIRVFPTPNQAYSGTGDYLQEVPNIATGRVDWPKGWDQIALLGMEYYLARVYRQDLVQGFKLEFQEGLTRLRNTDESRGVRPMRAISTRRTKRRGYLPHDNSTDFRGLW